MDHVRSNCERINPKDHVLVFQDTTEQNYAYLNGRLKVNDQDIGVLSDDRTTGFLMHVSMAVVASTGTPIGISDLQMWQRRFDRPRSKSKNARSAALRKLPIEEKESYKWLRAAAQSKACLSKASHLTIIGDRENDIYEYFTRVPDERTDILVRSSWDRQLSDKQRISEYLEQLPWQGHDEILISSNKHRQARTAHLRIRYSTIKIKGSRKKKGIRPDDPKEVQLQVVEVKESPDSVPTHDRPIHWILLTTHQVQSLVQAQQIIQWYYQRWWIEDLFRTLKTKGLEIESSQLGNGLALKKLVTLCVEEALNILLMRQERNGKHNYSADLCFDQHQQYCLQAINEQVQGNTVKQQNPFAKQSLAWAVWIVARLGGWSPRDMNKRPPGVISIARGIKVFHQQYLGFKMALIAKTKFPNNSS